MSVPGLGVKLHSCWVGIWMSQPGEHRVLLSVFVLPARHLDGFVGKLGSLRIAGFELDSLSGVKRWFFEI